MSDYPCIFCDGNHSPKRGPVHCIRILADRMKELESKLGAADAGLSTSREAVGERPITTSSPPAAPSVSAKPMYVVLTAEEWRELSVNMPPEYYKDRRAIDLAAAVAEWAKSPSWGVEKDNDQLRDIALAFVRGEPLPEMRP